MHGLHVCESETSDIAAYTPMTKNDGSAKFRSACETVFRFLEADYGFTRQPRSKKAFKNAFDVEYANQTIFIRVEGIHYGSGVTVRLGRLKREDWETYNSYDLEDLIAIRCPELSLVGPDGFGTSKDQVLQLNHYCHVLKTQGLDVLNNDLSIFKLLHEAILQRAARYADREV